MKEIKIYEIPNIDFIERIDDPYIGMIFYVADIDTYYSVKTLKEINGINMKGSKVVEYVIDEYADFGTGSGGGSGLTATQLSNIAKIPAIQSTVDALPNNYASKNHNHSEYASSSHRHNASEIDNLPSGGGTGLTTEQAQQLQTAYEHSQTTHVQASDIPSLEGYATENFVTNKIAEASLSGSGVDLSGYATKDELNAKADATHTHAVSDITNLSISTYQTKTDNELITQNKTIVGAINETFQSVSNGKTLIASAITDKGVTTSNLDTFQTMANNIGLISSSTPSGTKDAYRSDRILVWEDDFDGTALDLTKWTPVVRERWNHLAYTTDREENVYVSNSNLIIKPIREKYNGSSQSWTSGLVRTLHKAEFMYGRIEAKIKMPQCTGAWPAFWTMGANHDDDFTDGQPSFAGANNLGVIWPDCGEIDIVEMYDAKPIAEANFHYGDGNGNTITVGATPSATIPNMDDYHIYGMEWTEKKIEVYVDDVVYKTYNNTQDCFKFPHYLMLNYAVRADVAALANTEMAIDWVRVYAPIENTSVDSLIIEPTSLEFYDENSKFITTNIQDTIALNKTITWESTDTGVAKVYSGQVIPQTSNGNCNINIKVNGNIIKTCPVTVNYGSGGSDIPNDNLRIWISSEDAITNNTATDKQGRVNFKCTDITTNSDGFVFNGASSKMVPVDNISSALKKDFSLYINFKSTVSDTTGGLFTAAAGAYGAGLFGLLRINNPYLKISDTEGEITELTTSLCDGTEKKLCLIRYGNVYKIYINGSLISTKIISIPDSNIGNLKIGFYDYGTAVYYNGTIKEFKLFNIALTEPQISGL